MAIKARFPVISEDDTDLAIRLGMAVAFQWDNLSQEAKDILVEQATFVEMEPMRVQQRQALDAFIKKHKVSD